MLTFIFAANEYRLDTNGYSGPDGLSDCLKKHNGLAFKVIFSDAYKQQSFWWSTFGGTDYCSNLNGVYRDEGVIDSSAPMYNIYWNSFKGDYKPLKRVRMSILL